MTNREWLYSLSPEQVDAWFKAEHMCSIVDMIEPESTEGIWYFTFTCGDIFRSAISEPPEFCPTCGRRVAK